MRKLMRSVLLLLLLRLYCYHCLSHRKKRLQTYTGA